MSNKVLAQSVLALQANGSIYHLGLFPGELAETVFLVGDPARVQMLSSCFDQIELTRENREFITHTGVLSGRRVSVVSTGIGAGSVDIALNEIDALHNIDFQTREVKPDSVTLDLIRIGTCGGLQQALLPGEKVVSQYAVGFDGALCHYAITPSSEQALFQSVVDRAFVEYPLRHSIYTAVADQALSVRLAELGQGGITLTCPGFYAAQQRQLRVPISKQGIMSPASNLLFHDCTALNFEMETALILGLGAAMGHRCVSISLVVFNRVTEQQLVNAESAMHELVQQVFQCLL